MAEYALTEKINLRTVLGLFSYEHMRSAETRTPIEGTGSISPLASAWLSRRRVPYPNLQFLPELCVHNTNVGLNATINVF